ncbi:MAG: S8 family serine peptidase [bacterium]|nr:S8 family serine peptidase [bacterium]
MVWRSWLRFRDIRSCPLLLLGWLLLSIAGSAFPNPTSASSPAFEQAIVILSEQADFSQVDARCGHQPGAMARRHQFVIEELKQTAALNQSALLDFLEARKQSGEVLAFHSHFLVNCIVIEAVPSLMERLRHWPGVESVERDLPFTPIEGLPDESSSALDETGVEPGLVAIRAPLVWDLGITGAGILVSHLDGGCNGSHPALADKWRGSMGHPWNECWLDLAGTTTFPTDNAGHGSQTMGILCGMVPGDTIGVAWGASYIAARMDFSSGVALISAALTAFEWIADPDGNPATFDDVPRVLSNSWGLEAASYPSCYSVFDAAIANCEAAGVCVFFAAGNEGSMGSGTLRVPAARSLTETRCFSVGAYDRIEDSLWYLSSLGPSPCTQDSLLKIKPELVAPGRSVRSACLGSAYCTSSGTSYAVAHAAGVAALMMEANPELSADSVQKILFLTAVDKGPAGNDNAYGYGHLDAFAAVMGALGGVGWLALHVTDPFGYPIEADVAFTEHPQWMRTNAEGNGQIAMPAFVPLELRITAPTFQEQTPSVMLTPGDTALLSVALPLESDLGLLTGTVINCSGQPAAGARVYFPGTEAADVYADPSGWFRVVLAAGFYDVWADDGNCAPGNASSVQVVAQGMTDIEIILPSNPNYLCSDPDPVGYVVCDDNDSGGPLSRWVEIAPAKGGNGIVCNLNDDGTTTIGLPFPVVFYGRTHHRVYINANGNLTFDRSLTEHINVALPRLCCPALYPFWDDLNDEDGGDICADYLPDRGLFVVEWSEVPRYDELGSETFEVIFFDTALYPTTSGETYIEFHYGELSVTNSGTVGIDAGDGSGYLEYLHNGNYPAHASPLQSGRALSILAGDTLGGTPQITILNSVLEIAVPPESEADTAVSLRNDGSAPLSYALPPPEETSLASFRCTKSTDSGGPPFAYLDISAIGTQIGIAGDDTTSDPIMLPWLFPYCGRYVNGLGVCTNGYASFVWCRSVYTYFHYQMYDDRTPPLGIFPYWNDLDPTRGGGIFSYYDEPNDRFIVEWHEIRRYNSTGPNSFEIMLYRDGTIQLAYAAMSPSLVNCTVGLSGGSPAEYRQLAFNQNFLQSNFLVRFDRLDTMEVQIILQQDQQGVIAPGQQIAVPLLVRNNFLMSPRQEMSLTLGTSDPLLPLVPIQVEVFHLPDPSGLKVVVVPEPEGLRLHWNRLEALLYCIYSGTVSGEGKQFEASTSDTTIWLPYDTNEVRFYDVRICSDPPSPVSFSDHDALDRSDEKQAPVPVQKQSANRNSFMMRR